MTRAQAVKLGPFTGGMNTASDPTTVADSELVDCANFELDLDGSLIQRPAIKAVGNSGNFNYLTAIGSYSGTPMMFFSGPAGLYRWDGATLTLILANLVSKVALTYRNLVYVVATPGSAVNGGYYNPATDTWTTQPSMPRGEAAIFSKSRMFIVPGISASSNTSRLQFTDPITADAFTWTATNIIDVSPGDGQRLIDLVVYNDNLMLFKDDSTYVLAYDLQIADAVLRMVNPNIGVTSRYCVRTYENSVFVLHEGRVYEIVNYDFNLLNVKVPFVYDSSSPGIRYENMFLCIVGDRLIVRYFNLIYVYGLKTKTWSRWESQSSLLHNFGPFFPYPVDSSTAGTLPSYYAGSSISTVGRVYRVADGYANNFTEDDGTGLITISSYLTTKNYDFADPQHFKKLMWWGIDILTNQPISAFANPVVAYYKVRWNDIRPYRWNSLSTSKWYAPLAIPVNVETDVSIATSVLRKFVKLKKAMRFRQINFKVVLQGDGSPATGPARVFSLTAIVADKQLISKQVS